MISLQEQEGRVETPSRWIVHKKDRPSATELNEAHFVAVYGFVSSRIRPREDAEDVTQETFVAAYKELHKLKGDARLWLYGIARRKVADLFRKRSRMGCTVPEAAEDVHLAVETREAVTQLRGLIAQLPQNQQEALLLQHLEGLSIAQIAVVMNRSPKSIKGLVARARETLYANGKSYFAPEEE